MGVGGQPHVSAALPPGKRPGTHCTGGGVQEISSPPEFDPQTVHSEVSRYTD